MPTGIRGTLDGSRNSGTNISQTAEHSSISVAFRKRAFRKPLFTSSRKWLTRKRRNPHISAFGKQMFSERSKLEGTKWNANETRGIV